MSNEVKNDTKVLKSKRFVVRMSLVGIIMIKYMKL